MLNALFWRVALYQNSVRGWAGRAGIFRSSIVVDSKTASRTKTLIFSGYR
ncbi:hypothetical protein GNF76_05175 [Pseudomonas sp. CCM 7893]|uniref:Uncharacterized protein n=1 Tax=Pseudomonas spelaei TaxID=1055469 RepID=A0A6I3W8E0_9PSED|nr:hypothetical protein [Pseudomonas spelaei]MUF03713.1 hypothetical protein [Pseudomonas spelaei]